MSVLSECAPANVHAKSAKTYVVFVFHLSILLLMLMWTSKRHVVVIWSLFGHRTRSKPPRMLPQSMLGVTNTLLICRNVPVGHTWTVGNSGFPQWELHWNGQNQHDTNHVFPVVGVLYVDLRFLRSLLAQLWLLIDYHRRLYLPVSDCLGSRSHWWSTDLIQILWNLITKSVIWLNLIKFVANLIEK